MRIDGFLLGMLIAVGAAFAAPQLGASAGSLHMGQATEFGVALVFFLHGAELSPKALRDGAANWRLHLFIQASTYVLFPILGGLLWLASRSWLGEDARLGLFYLCALCSTISSSVAMTSLAKGNVSGAVFDATLSGILGMLITPALVSLVRTSTGGGLPLGPEIVDVMTKLLLPFLAGQLLRPVIGRALHRRKSLVSKADRGVILLIIYGAFCDAAAGHLWSRYSPWTIVEIALLAGSLLAGVLCATTWAARTLGFSREDEVAAVFCGSKKSLANGAPIAKVLFGASPQLGMIMLPLMLYHQFQLIVCASLARRYAAKAALASNPVLLAEPAPAKALDPEPLASR